MPVPEHYKRYEKIAERLGFKLDVSPRVNSMRDNFSISDPLADTAITLHDDDGKALLEFLNTSHFARADARVTQLDSKIIALDGRVRKIERERDHIRRQPMGNVEIYADIERLGQEYAIPAGGNLEITTVFNEVRVRYFRCKKLRHNTVFSDAMLREPYHSGQNHRFYFEIPRDYEILCEMLRHDLEVYQQLFPSQVVGQDSDQS